MDRIEILNLALRAMAYMEFTFPIRVEQVSGKDSRNHKKALALAGELHSASAFLHAELEQLKAEQQEKQPCPS